jgi:hypothetical protein
VEGLVPRCGGEAQLSVWDGAVAGYGVCSDGSEDREARECLAAVAADEEYLTDHRRQHPELVEEEQAIFQSGRSTAMSSSSPTTSSKAAAMTTARRRRSMPRTGGASSPTPATMTPARTQWVVASQWKIGSISTMKRMSMKINFSLCLILVLSLSC